MKPQRIRRELLTQLENSPTAVEEFQARWNSCKEVRHLVSGVLTKALDRAILQSESPETWGSPNALATLADQAGYRRGLREAIKLLTNCEEV